MANENITKVALTDIELLEDGQRANADNLNRPIIQLSDNQKAQNKMLDEIYEVLGSDSTDLDELQEVIDKLNEFKETLKSDDGTLDTIQEIIDLVKKSKERLDNEHDENGNHIFVDTVTDKKYKFTINDGDIELEEV